MRIPILIVTLGLFGLCQAQDAAKLFAQSKGAVVTVETEDKVGTGFVVGDGMLVVTAYHVIEGARRVNVNLKGISVLAVHNFNADADIAVLRLSKKAPKALTLATSLPSTGSKIYVIGTPLGYLEHTITDGILSGVRVQDGYSLLQITAPISPGSSGSPVLNASGNVVGLVRSTIVEGQGLNFAVTMSSIRPLLTKHSTVRPSARSVNDVSAAERIRDLVGKIGGVSGEEASRKLSGLGAAGIDALEEAAKSENETIRSRAIAGLIRALSDTDSLVRSEAAVALGKLGDKRAFEPLIRALSDTDKYVRKSAAMALGWLDGKRAVEPLIRALSDSDKHVRLWVAIALGYLGDNRAVEPLIRALSDTDSLVRSEAAVALGKLGDKLAIEPLRKLLNDPNENVRKEAKEALKKLGG